MRESLMGNIGSHSGQISGSRAAALRADPRSNSAPSSEFSVRSFSKTIIQPQVKVLPNPESRQRLRHTNNGEILHSGGTLSGRHQTRNENSPHVTTHRYHVHKTRLGAIPYKNNKNVSSQKLLGDQLALCKSEPDLRFCSTQGREMREKRIKKKYKAPLPPKNGEMQEKDATNWDENFCSEYPARRTRLFKTREESKKESGQTNTCESMFDNFPKMAQDKIYATENIKCLRPMSLPELSLAELDEFKKELKEATNRLRTAKLEAIEVEQDCQTSKNPINIDLLAESHQGVEEHCVRGEPSGKESSTPETSPVLDTTNVQKPISFYFGMEREDSDASESYPIEDSDENHTIALRLRPVLPRKPTQIPRFSPATAWKLLDARSQDSGISGDARPPFPSTWTPQQDLEDDSSIEETLRYEPRSLAKQRRHIFSLSLPRDHQPADFLASPSIKTGVSSLRRLRRSVSGLINLSVKKDNEKKVTTNDDESNWFFTRSAPNSLNEYSPDMPEACFPSALSNSRLIYLPDTAIRMSLNEDKYLLPSYSKCSDELQLPESLQDINTIWSNDKPKKNKKFTFQSTVRQIERKKMADRLSREAEKKEKQRIRELEIMRRVEEEFKKKRAKEKATIRQQLRRLYAMGDSQWTGFPISLTTQSEERQEPDGAISSSDSFSTTPSNVQEEKKIKEPEENTKDHITQELSEFRQIQRDYKEFRGRTKYTIDQGNLRQTTIHPEVIYNMPKAKELNLNNENYRKDFAYGMKSTKSVVSNQSEDSQQDFPKLYSNNKYSSITRF